MPQSLDDLASKAIQAQEERRSILFAEEAAGYVLQVHGREKTLAILRQIAQHIEDYT